MDLSYLSKYSAEDKKLILYVYEMLRKRKGITFVLMLISGFTLYGWHRLYVHNWIAGFFTTMTLTLGNLYDLIFIWGEIKAKNQNILLDIESNLDQVRGIMNPETPQPLQKTLKDLKKLIPSL